MKVFMQWDMEGVSGVFSREHVWFWEELYARMWPKRAGSS